MTIRTPVQYPEIVEVVVPSNNGEEGIKIASLKSKTTFEPGSFILKSPLIYPTLYEKRDFTTVQIEDYGHMKFENEFEYMNHSCDPTAALVITVQPSGEAHLNIKVLKKITPGDDITFFYPSTEWVMDEPFQCWCKSENCVKNVQGAKFIDLKRFEENKEKWGLSPYILNKRRDLKEE